MSDQIHKGDTLGIWTFNDDLHAGIFPLQHWSPESQKAVTGKSLSFLKQQKNEHSANLEKVLPTLERVIKSSDALTVVLISAGQAELHGTPFDARINQSYRLWRDEQQKARMPIVTALRCSAGKVVDYSIAAAPWPVEIPAPKPETQFVDLKAKPEPAAQKTNAPAVSQAPAPPKPVPTLPPLIISGKKPAPLEPEKTEIVPTVNPSSTPAAKTEAPVAAVAENAKEPVATPAGTKVSTNASISKSPIPASALSENHPNETAPLSAPALAVRARENADAAQSPAKATLASPNTKPQTALAAVVPPSAPSKSKPRTATLPRSTVPQTAVATPASVFTSQILLLFAIILAAVSVTIVFAVTRQRRAARSASLITRSFDRK